MCRQNALLALIPVVDSVLPCSTLVTSDFAVSRALVSTHLLLLVLGRMYFKHGLPTPAPLQVKGTAAAGCSSPPPSSAVLAALMSQLTMDADDAGELRTGIKEAISAQLQVCKQLAPFLYHHSGLHTVLLHHGLCSSWRSHVTQHVECIGLCRKHITSRCVWHAACLA